MNKQEQFVEINAEGKKDLDPVWERERKMVRERVGLQYDFINTVLEKYADPVDVAEFFGKNTSLPGTIGTPRDSAGRRDLDSDVWKEFTRDLKTLSREQFIERAIELWDRNHPERVRDPESKEDRSSFSYNVKNDVVHMHFNNRDSSGVSPLDPTRRDARIKELTKMFREIKDTHGDRVRSVYGGSWLYNDPAILELFPGSYSHAEEDPGGYSSLGIWGQFTNKDGEINAKRRQELFDRLSKYDRITKQNWPEIRRDVFPLKMKNSEAPIVDFYKFYGIE